MVKNYEYTYLTRQDMPEEAAKTIQSKLSESITAKNGAVVDTPRAYKKRLAYRIKKQDTAYVNTIMFTLDTEKLLSFKKETDAMPEILRGLIVSYDPKKLEQEDRREPRSFENKEPENQSNSAQQPLAQKTADIKKTEDPEIAKKDEKEKIKEKAEVKEEKEIKEPKKAKKEDKIKEKDEKPADEKAAAKPKRKTKIKTELKDIEQKLDEILK